MHTLKDVKQFRQWLKKRIDRVNYKDTLLYLAHLQKRELLPYTVNHHVRSLKYYYNFLQTPKNPFQGLQVKGQRTKVLIDILNPKELQDLYDAYLPKTNIQLRNKVIIGLYVFQGIASAELKEIQVENVQLKKGCIRLPGNDRLNSRVLKLDAMQMLDMAEYLQTIRPRLKKQFNYRRATLIVQTTQSHNNKHNSLAKLAERLRKSYPKFNNLQQLRRSVIVNWLKTDNLRIVQYKAGHRYVSSTERYRVNNLQELRESILLHHPMDNLL